MGCGDNAPTYLYIREAEVSDAHRLDPLVQFYQRHRSTPICHIRVPSEMSTRYQVQATWNMVQTPSCLLKGIVHALTCAVDWIAARATPNFQTRFLGLLPTSATWKDFLSASCSDVFTGPIFLEARAINRHSRFAQSSVRSPLSARVRETCNLSVSPSWGTAR